MSQFALAWVCAIAGLCVTQSGCVYRRMMIQSDPPGALVLVDGEEYGYTPVGVPFTYYGTREITLIKDGFETLSVYQKVPAPWYQRFPVEFFADNLLPYKVTDRQQFFYKLQPQALVRTEELLDRAEAIRSETQVGP
jgi:hypothetical protein